MTQRRGFTLIELIIVIALLTSVTAVAAPSFFSTEDKAEMEACQDQMDFILNGFQSYQYDSESIYSYREVTDGQARLTTFINNATDPVLYAAAGFTEQVQCPSGLTTEYQAVIQDDKLYVYCSTHDVYSHAFLTGRPVPPDTTVYTNLDKWTNTDDNWIVGDHESFFVLPIEDQYYHMEIGFQLFKYDDGDEKKGDDADDPVYDYHYSDDDWYQPIPTEYYDVNSLKITDSDDEGRPYGYVLDNINLELAFALAIDFQETDDGYDFSSNALELKNINSNAAEELTVDIAENSIFSPDTSLDKEHNRQFFDTITDWIIVDIVENDYAESVPMENREKTMYVHMLDDDNVFQQLFVTNVPVADSEEAPIRFAFFMGKYYEGVAANNEKNVKDGKYYSDAYPSPVQVMVKNWIVDYDGTDEVTGRVYEDWYDTEKYSGYEISHPYILGK